jgi:hypothetical protein
MQNLQLGGVDPLLLLNKHVGATLSKVSGLHPMLKVAGIGTSDMNVLDYSLKMPLQFQRIPRIVLVGCGGTGSHLLPNILQYVWAQHTKDKHELPEIVLIDGDVVEQKNLVRQRFTSADLTLNKAAALARRYTSVFGLRINAFEGYISRVEELLKLAPSDRPNIIIGAVDNHRARMVMWQYFMSQNHQHPVFWIDSGNEGWNGQTILGARPDVGRRFANYGTHWAQAKIGNDISPVDLPCFFDEYPKDFLKIGGTPPIPQNECARMVEEDPQTIQANMMSAFCATSLTVQVLSKQIRTSALYFDAMSGNTKATFLTRVNIAQNLLQMENSREQLAGFLRGLDLRAEEKRQQLFNAEFPFLNNLKAGINA